MNYIIILLSVLISVFVLLFLFNFKSSSYRSALEKIEGRAGSFLYKGNRSNENKDIKLMFEENKTINIVGAKIRSLEGLFLFRIIISLSFLILFNIFGILFDKNFILYSIIGAVIFYFLPLEIIKGKINFTRKIISNELPEILDILSSLIKAGLSLDEAINYISINYKGEVSKLFTIAQLRVLEGISKKEAYYKIAQLSFCNDFKTIIKILIQSEMIGNPINVVLRDLSKVMRNNQRDQLKIKAERLEGNLVLIIFIFIFIPMMFLFMLPVLPQLRLLF